MKIFKKRKSLDDSSHNNISTERLVTNSHAEMEQKQQQQQQQQQQQPQIQQHPKQQQQQKIRKVSDRKRKQLQENQKVTTVKYPDTKTIITDKNFNEVKVTSNQNAESNKENRGKLTLLELASTLKRQSQVDEDLIKI